jgi:hypothetical protein
LGDELAGMGWSQRAVKRSLVAEEGIAGEAVYEFF